MRTLYVKMKTETGSSVYRNVAPQSGTNKLSFATGQSSLEVASNASDVIDAWIPLQTEAPDLKNEMYQIKVVDEWTVNYANQDPVTLHGSDAWADTTDEKLVLNLTDGDKAYTVKFAKAATATDPAHGQIIPAARAYGNAIQSYFKTADVNATVEGYDADWTSVHLTGTKDSLVAQPD